MTSTTNSIYCLEDVPLYETLYGDNLISLGGVAAVENMFSDIDLTHLTLLDVGFGLGGVAFYLAKKYHVHVSGIEVHPWMMQYATKNSPKEIANLLNFCIYNEQGEMPFEAATFDLVYSKGVLNHVHDKLPLFKQINKVLKAGGTFVIADWVHHEYGKDSQPLVKESLTSYQKVLEQADFVNTSIRDDSTIFLEYVRQMLQNLTRRKEFIIQEFGEQIFSEIIQNQQQLFDEIAASRKVAVRIKASKRKE